MATLVDNEELEDLYRSEPSVSGRRATRAPAASSTGDFAERSRSGRARAAMLQDAYDEDSVDDYDDDREESSRGRRRAPVSRNGFRNGLGKNGRRSGLLATRWGRIGLVLAILAVLGVLISAFLLVRGFFLHDARFRIDSASSIQILGNSEISRAQLLGVFSSKDGGSDIGRNIFTVPLTQRRSDLQQLPWVQSATVMRLLPNQLRVSIVERVPVAFVREGNTIQLVDTGGVILSMSPAMLATRHYSFPVVIGINASDPPETRADRMQVYEKFVSDLDSSSTAGGTAISTTSGTGAKLSTKTGTAPKVSQQLSEVDVSDPEDVRALMPSAGTDILVHFGDEDFANRYHIYQQHLAQWRQQYPHLAAIDLRYDRQTVLEMARTASQDPANTTADKVNTTPTLAATPVAPHAAAPAKAKPSATSKPVVPPTADKPTTPAKLPAKTPVKVSKSPKPAYVLPFDNPHTKHG